MRLRIMQVTLFSRLGNEGGRADGENAVTKGLRLKATGFYYCCRKAAVLHHFRLSRTITSHLILSGSGLHNKSTILKKVSIETESGINT